VNLNRLYTLMRASYVDAADARSALDSARQLREEAAARRAVRPARSPDSPGSVVAAPGAPARELGAAEVQPTAEQVKSVAAARAAARRTTLWWQSMNTTELTARNAALTKAGLEPIKSR
jgi:hypothetical protein